MSHIPQFKRWNHSVKRMGGAILKELGLYSHHANIIYCSSHVHCTQKAQYIYQNIYILSTLTHNFLPSLRMRRYGTCKVACPPNLPKNNVGREAEIELMDSARARPMAADSLARWPANTHSHTNCRDFGSAKHGRHIESVRHGTQNPMDRGFLVGGRDGHRRTRKYY